MINDSNVTIQTVLPILKDVTIFSGFSDDEIGRICESCTVLDAKEGELIVEEKTPAKEIFIQLKGRANVVLNIREAPIELMEFGPGSCIGEASVIGIQNHSASVVITENSTLLVLSRQVLMNIFENDKAIFSLLILNIAREIARRLHHTDETLLHYGKLDKKHHQILNRHMRG
ncbi:MAG: cyclic nucleotide-binding domain-containing protein [Fibrobacter sp.]|nr:cyclic nucleotide-binding domain-containing protein [Fibrobacter sp.]